MAAARAWATNYNRSRTGSTFPSDKRLSDDRPDWTAARLVGWTDPPYGVAVKVRPGHEFTGDATPRQATELQESVPRQADPYLRPGAPWYVTGPSGVAGIGFLTAIEACGWDLAQIGDPGVHSGSGLAERLSSYSPAWS